MTDQSVRAAASRSGFADACAHSEVEVALLDPDGCIESVNEAWVEFARVNGAAPGTTGAGVSYLAVCDAAQDDPMARLAAEEIRAALAGGLPAPVTMHIPCDAPDTSGWFDMLVSSRFDDCGRCVGATVTFSEREPPVDPPPPCTRHPAGDPRVHGESRAPSRGPRRAPAPARDGLVRPEGEAERLRHAHLPRRPPHAARGDPGPADRAGAGRADDAGAAAGTPARQCRGRRRAQPPGGAQAPRGRSPRPRRGSLRGARRPGPGRFPGGARAHRHGPGDGRGDRSSAAGPRHPRRARRPSRPRAAARPEHPSRGCRLPGGPSADEGLPGRADPGARPGVREPLPDREHEGRVHRRGRAAGHLTGRYGGRGDRERPALRGLGAAAALADRLDRGDPAAVHQQRRPTAGGRAAVRDGGRWRRLRGAQPRPGRPRRRRGQLSGT